MRFISPSAKIGKDVVVWHFAVVLDNVTLGDGVSIGSHSEIGAGSRIGRRSRIGKGVFLPANSVIGDDVFIGPNVTFTDDKYPIAGNKGYVRQPPVVEDCASIGAGSVILPGVKIGWRAMVGAGSVVTKDVEPETTVRGEPSRKHDRSTS